MKKSRPVIIVAICLVFLAAGVLIQEKIKRQALPKTHHSSTDNVSGWGWSDNIGWIGFNCTDNNCTSTNYGVNVNWSTGYFSGYAWSDNIGWINFAPSGTYPAAGPSYSACVDLPDITTEPCNGIGSYNVAGWVRVQMCITNPANCNGWEGWIKLGDSSRKWWTEAAGSQVKINPDTKEFEGWAWGSDVIGWISFNCKGTNTCGS